MKIYRSRKGFADPLCSTAVDAQNQQRFPYSGAPCKPCVKPIPPSGPLAKCCCNCFEMDFPGIIQSVASGDCFAPSAGPQTFSLSSPDTCIFPSGSTLCNWTNGGTEFPVTIAGVQYTFPDMRTANLAITFWLVSSLPLVTPRYTCSNFGCGGGNFTTSAPLTQSGSSGCSGVTYTFPELIRVRAVPC